MSEGLTRMSMESPFSLPHIEQDQEWVAAGTYPENVVYVHYEADDWGDDYDDEDFDIADEEQEAIELMMAWRNSGQRPRLSPELRELERTLDREIGPAPHDVDGDSSDDPQKLADMGYDRDDLEDLGFDSDDLDDIEWDDQ